MLSDGGAGRHSVPPATIRATDGLTYLRPRGSELEVSQFIASHTMASYLVTGSSRGIGLGIVTHLLSRPSSDTKVVFATARDPKNCASLVSLANSPEGLGRIVLVHLDVCDVESVERAASIVQRSLGPHGGLDVLINNAGVLAGKHGIGEVTDEELLQNLQTNALGVHRVTRTFLPLLQKGRQKKIINLGATLSSMNVMSKNADRILLHPVPGYAISKTAMNMVTVQWAMALKDDGFIVATVCPGWVASDMGGVKAPLSVDAGAQAVTERIDTLNKTDNGKFLKTNTPGIDKSEPGQYERNEIPW